MKTTIITSLLICVLLGTGVFSVQAGILNVPVLYQEQGQWCWAGVSQMILSYYNKSSTQCSMANYAFYQSSCCNNVVWPDGTGSSCNQPNYIYGRHGAIDDLLYQWGGIQCINYSSHLYQSTIETEINAGRPFVIQWTWTTGGGHFLAGRGIIGNNVYYNNPSPGYGYMYASYNWMVSSTEHNWAYSLKITTNPPTSPDYRVLAGGDYNGDGNDDIAIFRPSSGLWSVRGVTRVYWGTSGDIPVPGNYGGYGKTDIGVFRPSSGLWALKGYLRYYYGSSSDIPVPGDYDGNGNCNMGIYRPSSGLWSIWHLTRVYFGGSSDKPAPADYSGDNTTEMCIFRESSGLWACRSGWRTYYGRSGDIPVPMDTTGNGRCGPAIYRSSNGLWSVQEWSRIYFGGSSDQPVPADYQGGIADEIAIFRPSAGLWAIRNGYRYYYGRSGDIPVTR